MGLLDSNQVVVKQQIVNGSLSNINLSSTGGKGSINTSGKNGLCVKYVKTGNGDAQIRLSQFNNYAEYGLPLYKANGEIYFYLKDTGIYWIDTTGVDSVYLYCNKAANDTTASITYNLTNDAPKTLESLKPIQLIFSYDVALSSSGGTNVWSLKIPKLFKYFYIACHYEKTVDSTSTPLTCSGTFSTSDTIVVDGVSKSCESKTLLSWTDKKTAYSGFIENTLMADAPNALVKLTSGYTDGGVMHIRIYGVR